MISTEEDYNKLKYMELYEFECKDCHKVISTKKRNDRKQKQLRFLCGECGKHRTNIGKYGTAFPQTLQTAKDKAKQTSLERWGTEFPSQSKEFQNKVETTNIIRYGVRRPLQNAEILAKEQQTNLLRYGNRCTLQVSELQPDYIQHRHNSYIYKVDNYYMDSSWEVAFYVFHRDHKHNIKREPFSIQYVFQNKTYDYYPDFELSCGLVEIKGEQFFDKDGNLINPYDSSKNDKLLKLQQVMKENDVCVLRKKDLYEVFKYMKNTYGDNWKNDYIYS